MAGVHQHPFHEVWNAARLKERLGSLHPSAAYNALAALSQVTMVMPTSLSRHDCDASCLWSVQVQQRNQQVLLAYSPVQGHTC